jgi:type IV pilus assembly protein PilB
MQSLKKIKFGKMLLERDLITEEQLNNALVEHKKAGMKLGKFLIRQGILKEETILDLISEQLKIDKYHPKEYPYDTSLASLVPGEIAHKYQIAPLQQRGHILKIATTDPFDIDSLDTIEKLTNLEVERVLCSEHDITQLINNIYGSQNTISDVIENMEIDVVQQEAEKGSEQTSDIQVSSLQDMAGEAPIIRLVNSIFAQAVREGVSDIHISPQQNDIQIRFRIDGKLHNVPSPPKAIFLPVAARIKILANMDITISRTPQDGRFTLKMDKKEINVRVSSIPTIYGENLVLRLLDTSAGILTLDSLGMNKDEREKVETMSNKPYGMILSTGPTGCGKTTSLYSILNELNRPDTHIITIEDPIEYRIDHIRQIQLNRKAGMTFASGLRSILRQDPNIIMVGEIRDAETAAIAVQAAQTGHLVLSTVHTNDAAGAIIRLIDMGIEPFLVASVLLLSFAQRLVRRVCPHCKESYRPLEKALLAWELNNAQNANFLRGKGCSQCLNTGYKGRTGIFEVLTVDEMIQDLILKNTSGREITRQAITAGKLRTMKDDAAMKVLQGITTLEEAASAVMI